MTNRSGSYQSHHKLAIPDIFWDLETRSSYQAIGSERQIFSMSVNKTYNQNIFRQNKVIPNFLSFLFIGDCVNLFLK